MNKWLVNSIFGKAGEVFHITHIRKPVVFFDNGFGIFNVGDMRWYYFNKGKDYE